MGRVWGDCVSGWGTEPRRFGEHANPNATGDGNDTAQAVSLVVNHVACAGRDRTPFKNLCGKPF